MSRELTADETARLDRAWAEYLAVAETATTPAAINDAWIHYLDVMDEMQVYPSLCGYRVRI